MHVQDSYHSKWEPPFVFPWEQEYYERQMRKVQAESEKALQEALQQAERAKEQGKLEMAQLMLKKGLDASFISEITGLEVQLILSLAQSSV